MQNLLTKIEGVETSSIEHLGNKSLYTRATSNARDDITSHKINAMQDNEMEWKTRPMLGAQRIHL